MTAGQELKPATGDRLARGQGGIHILPTGVWASWKQAEGVQMLSQHVKGKVSREKPGPDGHVWGTPATPVRPMPWLPASGGHRSLPKAPVCVWRCLPSPFRSPSPQWLCPVDPCPANKENCLIQNKLSLCNPVRGWGLNNSQSFSNNQ